MKTVLAEIKDLERKVAMKKISENQTYVKWRISEDQKELIKVFTANIKDLNRIAKLEKPRLTSGSIDEEEGKLWATKLVNKTKLLSELSKRLLESFR